MQYLELFCKYNTLIRILDYSALKNLCRLSGTAKTARGVAAHGGKERAAYDPSINSGVVPDTYIALYRGCHSDF